jgi:hypothetical protein
LPSTFQSEGRRALQSFGNFQYNVGFQWSNLIEKSNKPVSLYHNYEAQATAQASDYKKNTNY